MKVPSLILNKCTSLSIPKESQAQFISCTTLQENLKVLTGKYNLAASTHTADIDVNKILYWAIINALEQSTELPLPIIPQQLSGRENH
jgi:hypothetical protein